MGLYAEYASSKTRVSQQTAIRQPDSKGLISPIHTLIHMMDFLGFCNLY